MQALCRHSCAMSSSAFTVGCQVRLHGLNAAQLNGAYGKILGERDAETGRWPVRLIGPPGVVRSYPDGVRVKEANLEPFKLQSGVQIFGWKAEAAELTPQDTQACAQLTGGWFKLPVPNLLGVPLAMKRLGTPRCDNESVATYMTVDPVSGFAPPDILMSGLGMVVVARTDGKDYSLKEMWALHDYNCHLMDCYSDWSGMSEAKAAPKRAKKLNPSAFQVYTQERADMYEDREDNDDDDDDDDDDELIPKVN